ncbi:MAG: hypothetical protein NVS2B12_42110 [Ktedonobacteraceae bacterium]
MLEPEKPIDRITRKIGQSVFVNEGAAKSEYELEMPVSRTMKSYNTIKTISCCR